MEHTIIKMRALLAEATDRQIVAAEKRYNSHPSVHNVVAMMDAYRKAGRYKHNYPVLPPSFSWREQIREHYRAYFEALYAELHDSFTKRGLKPPAYTAYEIPGLSAADSKTGPFNHGGERYTAWFNGRKTHTLSMTLYDGPEANSDKYGYATAHITLDTTTPEFTFITHGVLPRSHEHVVSKATMYGPRDASIPADSTEDVIATLVQIIKQVRRRQKQLGDSLSDSILEADREEREAGRGGTPDAFFKTAMRKLRHSNNLGQLRLKEWAALIEGAKANGYYVYVVTDDTHYDVGIRKLTYADPYKKYIASVMTYLDIGSSRKLRNVYREWLRNIDSRAYFNNKIVKSTRTIITDKDYSRISDPGAIATGLGIEDMFNLDF